MSNTNTLGRDGRQALRCFAKGMTGLQVARAMYRDGFSKAEAMKGIAECQAAGLMPATGASLAELVDESIGANIASRGLGKIRC